jgi:hypothetical protein
MPGLRMEGKLMKLVRHQGESLTYYTIRNVSTMDLAMIQLALVGLNQDALSTKEDWVSKPITNPNVLTSSQLMLLAELDRGVERKLKMRYYQFGSENADHPLEVNLRAFTRKDGSLYPHDADIRHAYVWCSGFTEHFIPVSDIVRALDNMDGKHGLEAPMAVIDKE